MTSTHEGRSTHAGDRSSVLVAGAGPVGLMAALGLGRRGIDVTVLEAGSTLSRESRASTFHPPSLEMLDELGVLPQLMDLGLRVDTFQYRDRRQGLIAEFDLSTLKDDTRFPFRLQCEQNKLCQIILDELANLDTVEVIFDSQVERVHQDATSVTAVTHDGREFRSDYLLGADGANSAVRQTSGLGFEGVTYPERYLVVSTEKEIDKLLPDISHVNYISDPEEWLVLLHTPEHWRAMFPADPEAADEEILAPAAVQRRMRTIADLGEDWPLLHTTLYRVHQRVASSYRVGRVLLAGDAAHINNPLGGLGMNSGLHDAYMLISLLSQVVRGERPESDLNLYDKARRSVSVDYVGRETDKNWKRIRERDEAERKRQQDELRELAADSRKHRDYARHTCMLTGAAGESMTV